MKVPNWSIVSALPPLVCLADPVADPSADDAIQHEEEDRREDASTSQRFSSMGASGSLNGVGNIKFEPTEVGRAPLVTQIRYRVHIGELKCSRALDRHGAQAYTERVIALALAGTGDGAGCPLVSVGIWSCDG